MIIQIIFWTVFSIVALATILWKYTLNKYRRLDKIPGPKPLPLIGNARDLGKNPVDYLRSLVHLNEDYGQIFKIYIGSTVYVIMTNPADVEVVMTSSTNITKSVLYDMLRPWLGEGLLISTGAKWKTRRRLITPTFHFKILEEFIKVFNSAGSLFVQQLASKTDQPIDIYPLINLYSLDVICETAMGTKLKAQDNCNSKYVDAVKTYMDLFVERCFSSWKIFDALFRYSGTDYAEWEKSLKVLHGFSMDIIKEKRKEYQAKKRPANADDGEEFGKKKVALLDLLLQSEEANQLSDSDVQEEIDTFIFEGHDTTTSAIAFTVYCLSVNPDVQRTLYEEIDSSVDPDSELTIAQIQDMKYLDLVVKESLRMFPSVPSVERSLVEDTVVGEHTLPKGTIVNMFIYGMHHQEEYFPNAFKFDPDRFLPENQRENKRNNFAYVPFSAGPRNCIGQKFALLEIKSIVIKMVQKFELLPVRGYKPRVGMSALLKSYNGVYVNVKARNK